MGRPVSIIYRHVGARKNRQLVCAPGVREPRARSMRFLLFFEFCFVFFFFSSVRRRRLTCWKERSERFFVARGNEPVWVDGSNYLSAGWLKLELWAKSRCREEVELSRTIVNKSGMNKLESVKTGGERKKHGRVYVRNKGSAGNCK